MDEQRGRPVGGRRRGESGGGGGGRSGGPGAGIRRAVRALCGAVPGVRGPVPGGIRRALPALVLLAGGTLDPHPRPLAAQADEVGRIERILRLSAAGGDGERHCGPTSEVGVLRRNTSDWQDGRCNLPLLTEDRIRVRPGTVVRLKIRSPAGEGDLALSADSLFSEVGGVDEGFFEIRETAERITGWELAVTRGSLALHWLRGQLALFNSGTRAVVSGTRLVLTADPDGQSGILHLIEGSVSFPDFPEVTMAAGEWARLRPGAIPDVTRAPDPVAERFQRTAEWSVDDAWRRPFYRSPWLYAGVAAVGAVAAWRIYADGDGQRRGTVILRLPW
jgi:hypothetical protein